MLNSLSLVPEDTKILNKLAACCFFQICINMWMLKQANIGWRDKDEREQIIAINNEL